MLVTYRLVCELWPGASTQCHLPDFRPLSMASLLHRYNSGNMGTLHWAHHSWHHSCPLWIEVSALTSPVLNTRFVLGHFFVLKMFSLLKICVLSSDWVRNKIHRNLFWQLSGDGKFHDSACHTPQQPLQNHPLGHLGGWVKLWSAEEMLDGQHQKVDIPNHARTAHKGLLLKRLEEDLCWIAHHVPPTTQSVQRSELNWTDVKWDFKIFLVS